MADVPSMSKGFIAGAPALVQMHQWVAQAGPRLAHRTMAHLASDVEAALRSAARPHPAWAEHADSINVEHDGNTLHVRVPKAGLDLEYGTPWEPAQPLIRPVMGNLVQRLPEAHARAWDGALSAWDAL